LAWTNLPAVNHQDFQKYDWWIQFPKALRDRNNALGSLHFPRRRSESYTGVVGAITETTLTDNDVSTSWDFPTGCTGTMRWADISCPGFTCPGDYYLVIDDRDEYKVVISHITANTTPEGGVGSLTFDDITDYVTSGRIPSVESLVGKTYYIVTSCGFIWWNQRWIQWPNDLERWRGTVSSGTNATLVDETNRFTGRPQRWLIDIFKGMEVLFYADDNFLKRQTILSNDKTTLTFATQSYTPRAGEHYVIVGMTANELSSSSSGSFHSPLIAEPNRPRNYPWLWYGGHLESYYSHDAVSDSVGTANMAATQISHLELNEDEDCVDFLRPCFDVDFWNEDDDCNFEECLTPDFYKTFRSWQLYTLGLVPSFIEPNKDYTGEKCIPFFALAMWAKYADINSFETTATTYSGGSLGLSTVALPEPSMPVAWTVLDEDGCPVLSGVGTATATTLSGTGLSADHNGLTVLMWLGFTRVKERWVKRLYDQRAFIPDYRPETEDEPAKTFDPPEVDDFAENGCFGVGQWIKRPKSTKYSEADDMGFVAESGPDLIENDLVRYVGSNWFDPDAGVVESADTFDPLISYWDHFFIGQHPQQTQRVIDNQRKGFSTGGSDRSLTDNRQNWYSNWYGGGVMRQEAGVVTSTNGTTQLTDENKITGAAHCFWQAGRFVNFDSPWQDFILKIVKAGVVYKTPILSADDTAGRITFRAVPGLTVQVGDHWTIDEPSYEVSRWAGRKLRIRVDPNNTSSSSSSGTGSYYRTLMITHSDNDTLFFEPTGDGFVVTGNMRYFIDEWQTGDVLLRTADDWQAPTGTDSRSMNGESNPTFRSNLTFNSPTMVKAYGFGHAHDLITLDLINELYRGIDALRWTKSVYSWDRKGELNRREGSAGDIIDGRDGGGTYCGYHQDELTPQRQLECNISEAETVWNDGFPGISPIGVDDAPQAFGVTEWDYEFRSGDPSSPLILPTTVETSAIRESTYSYGHATGIPKLLAHSSEWYAWAAIDFADSDPIDTSFAGNPPSTVVNTWERSAFDDNGTGLLWRLFSSFSETGPSTTDEEWSDALGNLDSAPVTSIVGGINDAALAVVEPTGPAGGAGEDSRGFYVKQQTVVLKWDVVGGMTYVT
jgi:hypothetical protein